METNGGHGLQLEDISFFRGRGKLFFSFLKKRGRGREESVMPLWKSKEVVVDRYGGRFAML